MLRPFRMEQFPVENLPGSHLRGCALCLVSTISIQDEDVDTDTTQLGSLCHGFGRCESSLCLASLLLLTLLQAHNMAALVACRCLLGVFEAGFGAGAPYYLSLFYQRRELGFRVSILLGMSPLANCFASALAYGITQAKGTIEPWRLLFIIGKLGNPKPCEVVANRTKEGIPTVAIAPFVWFFLADSPEKAKFLKEDEQTQALERLETVDRTAKNKLQWQQIVSGLGDYQNYFHTVMHFCCNFSFAVWCIASFGPEACVADSLPTGSIEFPAHNRQRHGLQLYHGTGSDCTSVLCQLPVLCCGRIPVRQIRQERLHHSILFRSWGCRISPPNLH